MKGQLCHSWAVMEQSIQDALGEEMAWVLLISLVF